MSCRFSILVGDLLHVRLLGQSVLVVNSEKVARTLRDPPLGVVLGSPSADGVRKRLVCHALFVSLDHVGLTGSMSSFGVDFSTAMLPLR